MLGDKYPDGSSNPTSMGKAFKLFWTNYVNFKGTSSRSEYWWWYLWNVIIHLPLTILGIIGLVTLVQHPNGSSIGTTMIIALISGILNLAMFLPSLALAFRRLRDAGLPGFIVISLWVIELICIIISIYVKWFYLPLLIIGIFFFIMNLMPSTQKYNQ